MSPTNQEGDSRALSSAGDENAASDASDMPASAASGPCDVIPTAQGILASASVAPIAKAGVRPPTRPTSMRTSLQLSKSRACSTRAGDVDALVETNRRANRLLQHSMSDQIVGRQGLLDILQEKIFQTIERVLLGERAQAVAIDGDRLPT